MAAKLTRIIQPKKAIVQIDEGIVVLAEQNVEAFKKPARLINLLLNLRFSKKDNETGRKYILESMIANLPRRPKMHGENLKAPLLRLLRRKTK